MAHVRSRTELRKRLNNHVAFREEKREEGKIGYVIRSILDSHKQGFCIDVPNDPDTEHFEVCFGNPFGNKGCMNAMPGHV